MRIRPRSAACWNLISLQTRQSSVDLLLEATMSGATQTDLDQSPRRRSPRLKNIRAVHSEDCETDFSPLKCVKTELIDPEETASPSTSELNFSSVGDNDVEQDLHNVTLKYLRARCKAKNQKTRKIISEGHGTMNLTQSWNLENETPKEEVDLDEPLIALKQKRQKTSSKAKRKMDAPISPHSAKVEDAAPNRHGTSPVQTPSLDATLHDSMAVKLERSAADLDHSEIPIEHTEEIAGQDICCAEMKSTTICKIETEDIDSYFHEEAGVSSVCENHSFEHSCVELHQVLEEDDGCGQQPGFITQPTELDVSDHSCELTHSVEAYLDGNVVKNKTAGIVSSLDFIDEVSNHRKSYDIANSDVDKSSIGSELLLCSLNKSGDDHIDHECWYPGGQANIPENMKTMEESSIDEFNTEMGSTSVIMPSDLCGSTERNCTSLEEVVQMQAEGQLDSLVCHDVRTNDLLLHMNVEQAATDYNFTFDKTLDLVHTVNFDTQDGWLGSIVFDALNNHVQRKSSESKTVVEVSDTAVILSLPIEANASHDSQLLLTDNMEGLSKYMNQLTGTINGDICTSVNDQGSREEFAFQHQLFEACVDMDKSGRVTSESSSDPEETHEIPAGASNSTATPKETYRQTKKSEFFIDEGSIEEHIPKKLLSKRKIMSPTSQEKLCNALTGIDLCGVQRLKRKIHLEDCDKVTRTLPQAPNKQDQSVLSTDRRLKGRTSLSYTTKGVLKSTESPSPQQKTSACMRRSSGLLDAGKAVEFSQRQMHDIENIAANLIRSLKHMRRIVDESLSSEAQSLLPNFNSAEIRAASEDALEVERTTRKWLTIMNKDCNRFCKILTLEGKKTVSHSEVPRKRRKIRFADEAGGTLCHVKVFSDGQISLLSECQREL